MTAPHGYTAPDPDPRTIYAYCRQGGLVKFGAYLPDDAREICRGGWKEVVAVMTPLLADDGAGGRFLPSIAYAETDQAIALALDEVREWAGQCLGRDPQTTAFEPITKERDYA